jgi:hypothetical protein
MQSKLQSLYESAAKEVVGTSLGLAAQLVIYPMFDIKVSMASNIKLAFCFSTVGVVSNYVVRRMFNRMPHP